MSHRFAGSFPSLVQALAAGSHALPAGASAEAMASAEKQLGTKLPGRFREFVALSDGAVLFNGAVCFWAVHQLAEKNARIRGAWFDARHLFFAEPSTVEGHTGGDQDPDWYFFDCSAGADDPAVRYMFLTPTIIGEAAPSFTRWLELICERRGGGVFASDP